MGMKNIQLKNTSLSGNDLKIQLQFAPINLNTFRPIYPQY